MDTSREVKSRVDPVIVKPELCSPAELAAFRTLVQQGDEVQRRGLLNRVKTARALVFLKLEGSVVGIAALKEPATTYRHGVFRKAGVPEPAKPCALELGWVYVLPNHRAKKYSLVLSEAALSHANGKPTFATTPLDNVAMQKTLEHLGFRRLGDSWPSYRGKRPRLVLYVTT
jgi:GNAT superfamily N-acetyltransferase